MTALNGFDDDGRKFLGMIADPLQGNCGSIFKDHHILNRGAGNSRRHRHRARCPSRALDALDQHLVELTVIVAVEYHDFLAAGNRARDPEGRHHGLGAGIAKCHTIIAGQFAEQRRHLAGEFGLRANGETEIQLLLDRLDHEFWCMTKGRLTEAIHQVDVLVTVDVVQLRSGAGFHHDRIDHFLPLGAKTGGHTRIRGYGSVGGGFALRAGRLCRVSRDEGVDVLPVFRADATLDFFGSLSENPKSRGCLIRQRRDRGAQRRLRRNHGRSLGYFLHEKRSECGNARLVAQ